MSRWIAMLLFGAAGGGLFLWGVNRWLLHLRDGSVKLLLEGSMWLVLLGGSLVVGWATGWTWWLVLPGVVLFLLLGGEMRRLWIRWQSRASPPVESRGLLPTLWQTVTTTRLAIHRYEVCVASWRGAPQPPPPGSSLSGDEVCCDSWRGSPLRVAHLSDLHLNDRIPLKYYRQVIEEINEAQVDFVLLTGDYVSQARFIPMIPDLLRHLSPRRGSFAVLGNHDVWTGASEVEDALRQSGIQLLGNGSERVSWEGGRTLLFWGCEDPWAETKWQAPSASPEEFVLVLTHTADNIYQLGQAGASAVFAGHYHAGQIRLPGLGALVVPSKYGRRFDHGHFQIGQTHLWITAGVGTASPLFRLYCPPDFFLVDFFC